VVVAVNQGKQASVFVAVNQGSYEALSIFFVSQMLRSWQYQGKMVCGSQHVEQNFEHCKLDGEVYPTIVSSIGFADLRGVVFGVV